MFPMLTFKTFILVLVILTNIVHILLSILNRKRISLANSNFDKIVNSFIVMFLQSLIFLLIYDYNFKVTEKTPFNVAYLLISNALLFIHTFFDINSPENKTSNSFVFVIINTLVVLSLYYISKKNTMRSGRLWPASGGWPLYFLKTNIRECRTF